MMVQQQHQQQKDGTNNTTNNNTNINTNVSNNNTTIPSNWKKLAIMAVGMFVLVIIKTSSLEETPSSLSSTTTKTTKENVGKVKDGESSSTASTTSSSTTQQQDSKNGNSDGTDSRYYTYTRRGQPMNDTDRQAMISKWGSWTLFDEKKELRPKEDFYKEYPNRDIPREKFPSTAWQIDTDYLDQFLPESLALVTRAQEAILAEYGKKTAAAASSDDNNEKESSFQERSYMFHVEQISLQELQNNNTTNLERSGKGRIFNGRPCTYQGGWTTPNGWDGLKKRLLHAVMTEDNFVFAMGGHSAAAGHGNHFQQSYTLQVQWILEAVLARLGVRHQARNFGNGGLGTIHNGLGAGSIYGPDVDVLMWDSSMTEGTPGAPEVMARQQLLGGVKVPVIWTARAATAKLLSLYADADAGFVGSGWAGIDIGTSLEQIENSLPWAMRYMDCDGDVSQICGENQYIGRCWIDRDDFTPPTEQREKPQGRASWHPGNRKHQLQGRVLAFTFLQALKDALTEWKEAEGYVLPDDAWHLTERYEKTRSKLLAMADEEGSCQEEYGERVGMGYVCKHGMKTRTEFTPRAYPTHSSIRSLMRPEMRAVVGESEPNVYNPPDVFNPDLHPPPGAIDVLNIVEAGIDFQPILSPDYVTDFYKKPKFSDPPKVPIGQGATLATHPGDDFCDGSVDSWCKRGKDNDCLLNAHNDGRNGIMMDSLSGWLVMNLPDLKNGYIALKIESWHWPEENIKTFGWKNINNETRRLGAVAHSENENNSLVANATTTTPSTTTNPSTSARRPRRLKRKVNDYCVDFVFEYAIDGKITALNKTEIMEQLRPVARVVEIITILDDPNYTGGQEKEVEVAIRMSGCQRLSGKVFKLTHLYWS